MLLLSIAVIAHGVTRTSGEARESLDVACQEPQSALVLIDVEQLGHGSRSRSCFPAISGLSKKSRPAATHLTSSCSSIPRYRITNICTIHAYIPGRRTR